MKERPILFSGSMVTAILEGRKTMTRRVAKYNHFVPSRMQGGYDFEAFMRVNPAYLAIPEVYESCPYGKPGDRLWVREAFIDGLWNRNDEEKASRVDMYYRADGEAHEQFPEDHMDAKWKPSIHMPRWASRITLEITGVRVERLQDISEEDAQAEGIEPKMRWQDDVYGDTYRDAFAYLWNKINGQKHPWASNPWVWVVEFKKI